MSIPAWFEPLNVASRLRLQAQLQPAQGSRFQPTGFPDLGAAEFTGPDRTRMLLVESAQSVANRLELTCWDSVEEDLVPALDGLPFVRVRMETESGTPVGATASTLEAHRVNSPYIVGGVTRAGERFEGVLRAACKLPARGKKESDEEAAGFGPVDLREVARALFMYDPNSILHGIFLEKLDGRARLARTLTGFIEAKGVREAVSGGVKVDNVNPSGPAKEGMGNVPFARTEYVADQINAYFTLDLALLRSYRLGEEATQLLTALALWKVQRFLASGLRLRTACDLMVTDAASATEPTGFGLPTQAELEQAVRAGIGACRSLFASPAITELTYRVGGAAKRTGK